MIPYFLLDTVLWHYNVSVQLSYAVMTLKLSNQESVNSNSGIIHCSLIPVHCSLIPDY